jgi:UDP-2-acetamido-2,6-beta-L-arabino-hexul-4-ose reductase
VEMLEDNKQKPPIILTSSIQADLDNPYGISKKKAENILSEYHCRNQVPIYIYRLPNVFGKWCRPNYNSVVATFCYNIAHGIDIQISDVNRKIELVYIDDVVSNFISILSDKKRAGIEKKFFKIDRTYKTTLGELAERIYRIHNMRKTLVVPDFGDKLMKCLYATYLSYLDKDQFSYQPDAKKDPRGTLVELLKSKHFGQIFVSKSYKGILRGNHYHNTKVEKFCVVKGKAVIKFRHIFEEETLSYFVSDDNIEIVDIPPGYTHSIENLGDDEMIVLFWANEIFNPQHPDTYFLEV